MQRVGRYQSQKKNNKVKREFISGMSFLHIHTEATNTKYITQLMHNINIKYTKEELF